MYRLIFLLLLISLFNIFQPQVSLAEEEKKVDSIIIEVEGDPEERKEYIEKNYPFIDVVATYELLFNGVALQGKPRNLEKLESLEFIRAIHTVQTYEALPYFKANQTLRQSYEGLKEKKSDVIPSDLNDTEYTGKGIKVGVVDTGIDYNHPDLSNNYKAGYDLVDLDDDPMETLKEEGIPTIHGSHVAGIIAADGDLKGVAPDAEIYSYRALGPGGAGTSVQVLAAMEQAVKDDVDVLNLSLGNSVNGPDYPTSVAVNRAVELGVPVVIANGNSGPNHWTVGAPATASKAFSVGASTNPQKIPYLVEPKSNRPFLIQVMMGSVPWDFERSHQIVKDTEKENMYGKIALLQRSDIPFYDLAKEAEEKGAEAVLIANNEDDMISGSIDTGEEPIKIPVAMISKEDGEWLNKLVAKDSVYLETAYQQVDTTIAPFSSRGPVTVNWDIKPDILAPGTNILSTVPGGYQSLQGTSMAAPHVAGVIALIKEAHPNWTTEQIYGAIETTAIPLKDEEGNLFDPIVQGMGEIQPSDAIETDAIIHGAKLSFGKIEKYNETKMVQVKIENKTNQDQTYYFDIPKKQKGITWELPQTFTVKKQETKTFPIKLTITSPQVEEGLQQGWLQLNRKDSEQSYQLPYLFINQTTDNPKAMGFQFALKPFSEDSYTYQLYVTEPAKKVKVDLYDPQTLLFDRTLLTTEELQTGMNEGEMKKKEIGNPGNYLAIITVYLEDGTYESYETIIMIE